MTIQLVIKWLLIFTFGSFSILLGYHLTVYAPLGAPQDKQTIATILAVLWPLLGGAFIAKIT